MTEPRDRRRGWLKNDNPPGDLSTVPQCGARNKRGTPAVSLPGHEERAVPVARRSQYGAANSGGDRGDPAVENDARSVLRAGHRRAAA